MSNSRLDSSSGGLGGGAKSRDRASEHSESQILDEEAAVRVNASNFATADVSEQGLLMDTDSGDDLDFLGGMTFGRRRGGLAKWFPWLFNDHLADYNGSLIGSASGTHNASKSTLQRVCPWLDENGRRQKEFMVEMRLLSRLRHPCEFWMPKCRGQLQYLFR